MKRLYIPDIPRSLLAYSIIDSIFVSLYWVVIAPYLKELGFTPLEYGVLGSLTSLSALVSISISGWFIDKYGSKPLLYSSLVMRVLGFLLMSTGNFQLIYTASAIIGFSGSLAWISFDVLVSHVIRVDEYHYGYSYLMALSSLGNAIGAYLGWVPTILIENQVLAKIQAYKYTMLLTTVSVPIDVLILYKVDEKTPRKELREKAGGAAKLPINTLKTLLRIGVAETLIALGAAISIHNIDYYFILKYNVGSGGLGTLYGTERLILALMMFYLPNISERIGGSLRTYVYVSSTSIPLLLAMTFINNYIIAVTLFVIRSVLMNAASPLLTAYTMTIIPPGHRGKITSILNLARRLAMIPGRSIGGYLLGLNLELPLRITAALYTTGLSILYTCKE